MNKMTLAESLRALADYVEQHQISTRVALFGHTLPMDDEAAFLEAVRDLPDARLREDKKWVAGHVGQIELTLGVPKSMLVERTVSTLGASDDLLGVIR